MRKSFLVLYAGIGIYLCLSNCVQSMENKEKIKLPLPRKTSSMSLEEALEKRRSERVFLDKDLNLKEISQLLWAAQGVTGQRHGMELRSSPSAGALYPMEIYLVSQNGLFHYLPHGHMLEILEKSDLRKALAVAALNQGSVSMAPADIVICAVYSRVTQKYGERGRRYAHIEAGHIAQNIHLQASALGLGSVPVGAFNDKEVQRILSLPDDHEPLYIISVGHIK